MALPHLEHLEIASRDGELTAVVQHLHMPFLAQGNLAYIVAGVSRAKIKALLASFLSHRDLSRVVGQTESASIRCEVG